MLLRLVSALQQQDMRLVAAVSPSCPPATAALFVDKTGRRPLLLVGE
jgi:hypothetical protein